MRSNRNPEGRANERELAAFSNRKTRVPLAVRDKLGSFQILPPRFLVGLATNNRRDGFQPLNKNIGELILVNSSTVKMELQDRGQSKEFTLIARLNFVDRVSQISMKKFEQTHVPEFLERVGLAQNSNSTLFGNPRGSKCTRPARMEELDVMMRGDVALIDSREAELGDDCVTGRPENSSRATALFVVELGASRDQLTRSTVFVERF